MKMRSTFLLVGLLVGAMGVCAGAASAPTVGPKMLQEGGDCLGDEILAWQRLRAERRVVIEEDDSAPIVCRDPAGRLYLVNGSGQLLTSDDNGETFGVYEAPKTITLEGQPVNDIQAFGVLKSTAPVRLWLGQARGPLVIAYGSEGRLQIARSEDDGASWQKVGPLSAEGYAKLSAGGVRIVQLTDGGLLLAVGAWKESGEAEGLVFRSADEGRTWSRDGTLGPRCVGANLVVTKKGELLAALTYQGSRQSGDPETAIAREELFNNVVVARSHDGGKTWQDYQVVTRYKEGPGDLTELSDGTLVLTYGQQNFPYGARAKASKDGGKTWEERTYLLGNSTISLPWQDRAFLTHPGWRVSSAAVKGDLLLTFYTRGSYVVYEQRIAKLKFEGRDFSGELGKEKGKSVQLVRWQLGGMKKPPLGPPAALVMLTKPNAEGYLDNGRCLVKPEHLNYGGDYFMDDEILVYQRLPAEHNTVGPGASAIAALDQDGNPVVLVRDNTVSPFRAAIYRSSDNGRTWVLTGRSPGRLSFGVLQDNTLLTTFGANHAGKDTVAVIRSNDWGKTWSEPYYIDPGPFDMMSGGDCTRIYQMPDGTALQTCGNLYLRKIGGGLAFGSSRTDLPWDGIYRSRDGGKTWGDFSFLGHPLCESNVIRLKSGRMLAAVRFQGSIATDDFIRIDKDKNNLHILAESATFVKNTAITYSDDDGYTWKPFKSVTRYNECPGDLTELPDGTVVMSYQQKGSSPCGSRATVSHDGGMTWDETLYMLAWYGGHGPMDVNMWLSSSGGHTSSVVLKDGKVLTLCNGWSPAQNCLMTEATIWQPLLRESVVK